jgi:hypothetical protein
VSAAAGVAISTVSNVLNRPQKVKTETRVKFLATMDRLGYVRNEQAYELSDGRLTSGRKHCGRGEPRVMPVGVRDEPHVPKSGGIQIYGSSEPLPPLMGCHVALVSAGRVMARGRIDMVTTDLSTPWVWLDGGKGASDDTRRGRARSHDSGRNCSTVVRTHEANKRTPECRHSRVISEGN